MRRDDWITKLYYKELSDKIRNNRDTGNLIPSKTKIPRTQDQSRKGKYSRS